jgi:hypothetical protein
MWVVSKHRYSFYGLIAIAAVMAWLFLFLVLRMRF